MKRIELSGFKSFADRTELEFVKGITAVVGPNGSGKSNISDGIRWVLGEQSARSLRGGNMQDIIFAGSDARKAVNFGEVSLTLDNSDGALSLDFSEVTVTRRVHRSGESEYLINKQPCRLKDITELFMDTGIGKEAYSIIGQGRIEEILSTKSEDRRQIFEEASGIVKYKSRKKEAEKKLNDTEQNLIRIHDLVTELEDQIEPLRIQSQKAVTFKQLKEQLKHSEIAVYVHQIEQIYNSWSDAKERLARLEAEQNELAAIVGRHDAHLEKHRWETRRLEQELEELQSSLLQISEDFEKCEGLGELLKERRKNMEVNVTQLETSMSGQEARIAEREAEIAEIRDKVISLTVHVAEFQAKVTREEERLLGVSGGLSSSAEDHLKSELLEKLNQMAQTRNEIRYAEGQMESIARRLEKLEEDREKWQGQKNQVSERRKELKEKLEAASQRIEHVRIRYVEVTQALKAKQTQLEELQGNARKWEQRMDSLSSRRDTMLEMQNDYDGFMHGVKEVLKAKNRPGGLRGIHGAVAELVKVPAKVELAMETALGGALQHVVVSSEGEGREAIAFLKQRQLGRATFLPLDVIRGRQIPDGERSAIENATGFVGIGVDLVEFEEKYRQVVSSLLGNVIVAETLEDANRIAGRVQYRYRVVTLEGDVVNPGGSMTGGSQQKKTTSLLGRQRQIDEIGAEMKSCEAQLEQVKSQAGALKSDIAGDMLTMEQLRQEGEAKRIEEQGVRAELNALDSEAKSFEERIAVYKQEREMLLAETGEFVAKKAESEAALARQAEEEADLQAAIRQAETARKASESVKEELQTQLTELKIGAAQAVQEKASLQEQQRRAESELSSLRSEFAASRSMRERLAQEREANEADLAKQAAELEALKQRKQQCAGNIELKRTERAEWLRQLEQEESHTRDQRNQLKSVEDQIRQTEVRVTRLDVELENLLKKLSEEYGLSYELAKERYPKPDDITAAQNTVRDLRKDIASLGDVNLGAIEEFERVNERYEFLAEQKNDLIDAKTTLYNIIRDIDDEMSKKFKTTFEEIRKHFVVVFAKLFGGGRADLILSEPDNLLSTGIEIVAQPPGKKLQNLQLLSGGERALTAIGLLFSILRVKPVPFCVLDEVEAALDEANVSRFAEYLREFSEQTQFIVVTHRKGTMEEADVLYGVTMQEGGVSKLVSVRLEDDEPIYSAS